MRKFFKEFKEFALKGNVIELAIGVIIGTSFNKIVTSLVNDIIMPLFGAILGEVDLGDLKFVLVKAATDPVTGEVLKPAVELRYGAFLKTVTDFLIVALTIFLVVKIMTKIRAQLEKLKEEEAFALLSSAVKPASRSAAENTATNASAESSASSASAETSEAAAPPASSDAPASESPADTHEPAASPEPGRIEALLEEIRDLLKEKRSE